MADQDGVVRIGTQVDLSGLRSGMAQAAEAAKSSSAAMAEAFQQAQQASKNLAEAQRQLGAAAVAGSVQAQQVIEQYRAAAEQASAVAASMQEAAASADGLDGAYQRLAQAAADSAIAQANLKAALAGVVSGETSYGVAAESLTEALRAQTEAAAALKAAKAEVAAEMLKSSAATDEDTASNVADAASTEKLNAAYQQLATAILRQNEANAGYKAAIASIEAGQLSEAEATDILTTALQQQAVATDAVKSAKAELAGIEQAATAAENENTEAVQRNTSAMRFNVEAYGSARIASGLATGSINGVGYALASVAARSSALGPILEVAFPVFAATALVAMLGQAISAITKFSTDAENLATELNTDWLTGAIGQVDGLAKAIKQADDYATKLAQDLDRDFSQQQSANAELIAATQGPAASDRYKASLLQSQIEKQQTLLSLAKQQLEADQQQAQAKKPILYNNGVGYSVAGYEPTEGALEAKKRAENDQKNIQDIEARIQIAQTKIETLEAQAKNAAPFKTPAERTAAAAMRKHLSDVNKAQEQIIALWRSQSAAMEAVYGKNLTAEEAFWESKVLAAQSGTKSYQYAIDQLNKVRASLVQHPAYDPNSAESRAILEPKNPLGGVAPATPSLSSMIDKMGSDSQKYLQAVAQQNEAQQKASFASAEATIRFQEQTGALTRNQAEYRSAALRVKELSDQLQRLNQQIAIEQSLGNKTGVAQLMGQKIQTQGSLNVASLNLQSTMVKPYLDAFNQINEGWIRVQNQILFSTRNIGLDFARMGQQLVISGVDAAEQWALKWIEQEALTVIFHQATNAQKEASDAASNAARLVQTSTTNVLAAESYAAVAAAAAAASAAAVPVVGWATAPAAAAAVYASTSAYAAMASFDTGTGYVPRDGLAMIHQGEAIIPAPTVEELRGSDGGGSSITINHSTHINAATDRAVIAAIHRNPREIAGALKTHMRQGGKV